MLSKVFKFFLYAFWIAVGFILYVQFRTIVVPSIADFKGDIKAEIESVAKSLPKYEKASGVTIKSLTYDDKYNLLFTIEFDKTLFQKLSAKEREVSFKEKRISNSLCNNELIRYVINNNGSVKANLRVKGYNLAKEETLHCLTDETIKKITTNAVDKPQ